MRPTTKTKALSIMEQIGEAIKELMEKYDHPSFSAGEKQMVDYLTQQPGARPVHNERTVGPWKISFVRSWFVSKQKLERSMAVSCEGKPIEVEDAQQISKLVEAAAGKEIPTKAWTTDRTGLYYRW